MAIPHRIRQRPIGIRPRRHSRARTLPTAVAMTHCAACGGTVPPVIGRGRPRRYCSPQCRQTATNAHARAVRAGTATRNPQDGRSRQPCRGGCGAILTASHDRPTPECRPCRRSRLCNRRCTRCNVPYTVHKPRSIRRYCEWCYSLGLYRTRNPDAQPRPHRTHLSRAIHYGVPHQTGITTKAVCERDRWRCGICGLKVDKRLRFPHPRRASMDHITPMARGGGHTWDNVQCAHLDCNNAKGARGHGEQLLLIGEP